jgi:hypothetical protein
MGMLVARWSKLHLADVHGDGRERRAAEEAISAATATARFAGWE